jgi:tRNA(adenine34) deaminase
MIANNTNIKFMKEALKEAQKAALKNEVPVGAVVVHDGKIVGRGHNQPISLADPTAHAEMIALRKAAKKTGNYRLPGIDVYVTIEPCPMCAGAMVQARISRLYFGARDPKAGAAGSVINVTGNKKFNHRIKVQGGILDKEARGLIQGFFKTKRK